jgi:hypothetical protein
MIGFAVQEVMEGTIRRQGEIVDRPFRIDFRVRFPSLLGVFRAVVGVATGVVRIDGLGGQLPAGGTLELSPFWKRRVRYTFELRDEEGLRYAFDGWKTITWRRFGTSWTTLPGTLLDEAGTVWGTGVLRFVFRRHLLGLLASFRLIRTRSAADRDPMPAARSTV